MILVAKNMNSFVRLSSQKSSGNQLHKMLSKRIQNNSIHYDVAATRILASFQQNQGITLQPNANQNQYQLQHYQFIPAMKANFSSSAASTRDEHSIPNIENNPLIMLKSMSQKLQLCDENGFRKKDCHWTFALSIADCDEIMNSEIKKAPILRTVNFQRVTEKGIDFVMKNRAHASDLLFLADKYVSFLYTTGKYVPGEKIEQWRAQGRCEPIRLNELIDYVPLYTIVEMVASVRANKEGDKREDMDLSHFTELLQQTRLDLEKGEVPMLELEEAVRAWRFIPNQVERMVGGPNQTMWDRKEWTCTDGKWIEPTRLMPF